MIFFVEFEFLPPFEIEPIFSRVCLRCRRNLRRPSPASRVQTLPTNQSRAFALSAAEDLREF